MPICSTCGTHYGATVRICVRDGTPLVAGRADDPHLGRLLDDKYRIESFISSGGMGSVYRAQHVMLGKTVAVKVIKSELVTSDEVVSRFQREARAASNLNHPNIVTVYDLGQTADGTLYIAMEFIDGPSLRDVLRRDGPMAPARTIGILRQVASALSAAHRKQIVHRDLKSHNLMLATDESGREIAKLVDFGIAKTFDESTQWTAAGYMLGTPHYMSPEQAAGAPVDHRADIYSLGVILYEMLTGAVPFSDESLTAVLVKLATEVPQKPSLRRPDAAVPAALEAVAMRCLEKNPDDRFQSADDFAAALDGAADEDAALAMPPPLAAARTLVRPAAARVAAAPAPAPVVAAHDNVPAARVRSGWSMPGQIDRRAAVVLVMLAAIGAAIASGVALTDEDEPRAEPPPVAATPPGPPPGPASAPAATALPDGATAAPNPAGLESRPTVPNTGDVASGGSPIAPDTGASAGVPGGVSDRPADQPPVAAAGSSAPASPSAGARDGVVGPVRGSGRRAGAMRGAARGGGGFPLAGRGQPIEAEATGPAARADRAAAAAGGPTETAVQAPAAVPSVFVACKGFPDVCAALRTEMMRAFQRDGVALMPDRASADVGVLALVMLVSETGSADFGTPLVTRTYSVELRGDARGTAVPMPEPHRFSFDPRVGGERLRENARVIAAEAAASVRAFRARTQP